MQGLAPPVIGWYVQPWHRARLIDELRDFFFHGHALDKVRGPLFGGQRKVHIRRMVRALGPQPSRAHEDNNRNQNLEVSFSHVSPE
jgi:hypothetical protein